MTSIRVFFMLLTCALPVAASSPASPYRHVVAEGECFLVMDPEKEGPPTGIAYRATSDGFKELWRAEGWYGFPHELFLSYDGMTLVRIRSQPLPWESGEERTEEPVLFIYFKGKLAKQYRLGELMEDVRNIEDLGSFGTAGWRWMKDAGIEQASNHGIKTERGDEKPGAETGNSYNDYLFRLETLERTELFFDLLDGRLIEKRKREPEVQAPEQPSSEDPFAD